ncbi:tRNA uracil 4-sulfurtransferase ThiI [Thiomicrorhabdus indica]|uniref:tRNA uracil 4-sulfurtransferase ThiI n=1 Tax=Thiomicrorhabdus indica TaxID=2267253 RepID=UPI00102DE242|nr:tRNA uracil 4-sulfurtransferase ThiI [Thiomicrorhabdus indica]
MKFIIKLFPEIMIKGGKEKKRMMLMLSDNLIRLLKRIDESIEIKRFHDKIEVYCDDKFYRPVRKRLQNTPGIQQFLEVVAYETGEDLQLIADKVAEHNLPAIKGKTFVVRAKRSGTHNITSFDIEKFVGGHLWEHGESAGVSLKNPEVKVELELHNKTLNVVSERVKGLGGFPMGSQGEVLSLMSGGFDSTVASYLTMKRGVKTHFVFFNLGGAAHEIGVKQVALYLWANFGASHRFKFISVPFEGVVAEIFNASHESYMGVMLKRLMLKASEKIADEMEIDALVTGESVAQVSSQTLRNLAIIDECTQKLVIRPLAVMDKPDIMAIADQIGTREYAENMPEYCGVISKNPVTNASFDRMHREESRFNMDVLDAAVASAKTINVDQIIADVNESQAVDVVTELKNETVIDIRRPEEVASNPLNLESRTTLTIPFFELNQKFKTLPAGNYVLYCDKGVMSQLHAQYLIDAGYENIKVYRPVNV